MSALGATDAENSALTSGRSGLDLVPLSPPRVLEIPFVQVLSPKTRCRLLSDDANIVKFFAQYESVTFLALEFTVEITGQDGRLRFAATPSDASPSDTVGWLGAPVYQRFAGNAHGDTFASYNFPATHPFGREFKATNLGNEPPRFFWWFEGSSGDSCSIRGRLTVRGGGCGIIPAIRLSVLDSGKASTDSAVGDV